MSELPKIIVILGPTASGKTDLSIALAKKFNGEIVSADSRQVYKKMEIGTAKPRGMWKPAFAPSKFRRGNGGKEKEIYMVDGMPHHMTDIVDPGKIFTLADYKEQAVAHIKDIIKRGKLPIIVGGTGLYIWAIVDNLDIPKMSPKKKMRESFENKNITELVSMLKQVDPKSAARIDLKNPRRIIRALEVYINTGKSFFSQRTKSSPLFDALQIGIKLPREELYNRVNQRCEAQITAGLIAEVESLVKQKYSWELPSMSGIGYRQISYYLRQEMSLGQAIELFKRDTRRYAKKQMTWFKRDKRIKWVEKGDSRKAEELVSEFLL